jgi:hypothetical protein
MKTTALTDTKATKAAKFRSIEEIMRDPSSKTKLQHLVDEAVQSKTKIAREQLIIKGLRDAALEDLGLKPALFNSFVNMSFNNDYQVRKEGLEQQLTLVEMVLGEVDQLAGE